MKNIYLLLLFFTLVNFTNAQPIITDAITPEVDDSWSITFLEATTFDTGPSGANQTWDFSNIDVSNSIELDINVLHPADVLGHTNFPESEFVWSIPAFEVFEFYSSSSDEIALIGGVSINDNEITFLTIFSDTEDGMQLPINYGDSYSYDSYFEQFFFGSSIGEYGRTGSVNADAYGTLITPDGTYENILRLIIQETSFGETSTQYAWFDVNNFTPVFLYETSTEMDAIPSIYYSIPNIDPTTSLNDNSNPNWNVWYNPVSHQIEFNEQLPSDDPQTEIRIHTIDGHLVYQNELQASSGSAINLPSNINCGILVVSLVNQSGVSSKKLMVCR